MRRRVADFTQACCLYKYRLCVWNLRTSATRLYYIQYAAAYMILFRSLHWMQDSFAPISGGYDWLLDDDWLLD